MMKLAAQPGRSFDALNRNHLIDTMEYNSNSILLNWLASKLVAVMSFTKRAGDSFQLEDNNNIQIKNLPSTGKRANVCAKHLGRARFKLAKASRSPLEDIILDPSDYEESSKAD